MQGNVSEEEETKVLDCVCKETDELCELRECRGDSGLWRLEMPLVFTPPGMK